MALRLLERRTETVHFISRLDTAIRNPDAYNEYLRTLDESILDLEGDPTRFGVKAPEDPELERAEADSGGRRTDADGNVSAAFARSLCRYVVQTIENPDPDTWKTPASEAGPPEVIRPIMRERGSLVLAREVVDRLPAVTAYEIGVVALRLREQPEGLRGK